MDISNDFFKLVLLSSALFTSQLIAAPINPENQPLGYIGAIEISTTDLTDGAKAYRGWFENGAWQGDLFEYDVNSDGVLTTSIDLSTVSPKQSPNGTNWSAYVQFATNADGSSHWDTGRKIITSFNGVQIPFRWASLDATQKLAISGPVLNFVRGDRSQERPGGSMRQRYTVLGDIIHSNPEYVDAPESSFIDSDYTAFKNAHLARDPRVYVGANDGMLHAFDANTGDEVWAYIPSSLIPKLNQLASVPYAHTYFVDGAISIRDAKLGLTWKTVLAGSLGAGGKGLYLLDVTDPNMAADESSLKLIGELPAADPDVGYIFGATNIVQLNDGKWYAVNGNGVGSVNGIAKLILIDIATGNTVFISTNSGGDNGLSEPALVDTDGDGTVDIAFAGDVAGDMWKFDLEGTSSGTWQLDYKLYNGDRSQPITTAPDITRHPNYGYLLLFGTGKLYETADITDTRPQALFGVWDNLAPPTGPKTLQDRYLSSDINYYSNGRTETVRTITTFSKVDYDTHKGWKLHLPAGERLLTNPQLRAGRLKATITNPDGNTNWFVEATFDDGTARDEPIFDLDQDLEHLLTADDCLPGVRTTDFEGKIKCDPLDIPMAWKRPDGNMSQATIASIENGVDTLFMNYLKPAQEVPDCTGDCEGGIAGGHIDVDTDSDVAYIPGWTGNVAGIKGRTNGHVHEYDDLFNRTYVDYFDINPDPTYLHKVMPVTDAVLPGEQFIILIANADLSPGGELTIGTLKYNVVEYQRMIHQALKSWDGDPATLKDPDLNSLVFTLDGIRTNGGTLRTTFNSMAILAGGLMPTGYECVRDRFVELNGRWRNGSLVMHLVRVSHFATLTGKGALGKLNVQTPTDLKTPVILADGTAVELTVEGGLTAKKNTGFLYESALFWHWRQNICYAHAGYDAALAKSQIIYTDAEYQKMLEATGFTDLAELTDFMHSLDGCKDVYNNGSNGGCAAKYKQLKRDFEALYEIGLLKEYAKHGATGDGGGNSPDSLLTGRKPIKNDTDPDNLGATSGPNFKPGRRSWIDIIPKDWF